MAEETVTYPGAAVIYDPIKREISMMVIPGPGETARFTVPTGNVLNILPVNDPFIQQRFADYVRG